MPLILQPNGDSNNSPLAVLSQGLTQQVSMSGSSSSNASISSSHGEISSLDGSNMMLTFQQRGSFLAQEKRLQQQQPQPQLMPRQQQAHASYNSLRHPQQQQQQQQLNAQQQQPQPQLMPRQQQAHASYNSLSHPQQQQQQLNAQQQQPQPQLMPRQQQAHASYNPLSHPQQQQQQLNALAAAQFQQLHALQQSMSQQQQQQLNTTLFLQQQQYEYAQSVVMQQVISSQQQCRPPQPQRAPLHVTSSSAVFKREGSVFDGQESNGQNHQHNPVMSSSNLFAVGSASPSDDLTPLQRFFKRTIYDNNENHSQQQMPAAKKRRLQQQEDSKSSQSNALLHNSCKLFSKAPAIVESALQFDPDSIRSAVPMVCHGPLPEVARYIGMKHKATKSVFEASDMPPEHSETYKYAINIALKHDATPEVLDLLAAAGPDVLTEPDGPNGAGTLGIALASSTNINDEEDDETRKASTDKVVSLLLAANPKSATMVDRYKNAPMHYAVRQRHVSLNTVSQIHQVCPEALFQRNFHGQTPLDVAVHSSFVPENVLDHLQMLCYSEQEQALLRNLDQIDEELLGKEASEDKEQDNH